MMDMARTKKSFFKKFQSKATAVINGMSDLMTDSVPSMPRTEGRHSENSQHPKSDTNREQEWEDVCGDEKEDVRFRNAKFSSSSPTSGKNSKFSKKKKWKKERGKKEMEEEDEEDPYTKNSFGGGYTFNHSKNIHIGTTNSFLVGREQHILIGHDGGKMMEKSAAKESSETEKRPIRLTNEIQGFLTCTTPCTREHILYISEHIGDNWRTVGGSLGFSRGQMDQLKTDYGRRNGQSEVIFQMLLRWTQERTDDATLGVLSKALWESDEKEAVKLLLKFTDDKNDHNIEM